MAVVLALGAHGCAAARPVATIPSSTAEEPVYLVSHGWHVGLVMRREDATSVTPLLGGAFGSFRYLEFGWGDGDYYPARRGTIRLALRAAFDSRSSVLQVVGVNGTITETFPWSKILRVDLSPRGIAAVDRYLRDTFELDPDGHPIAVAPAEYGFGFFYLARGRYRLLQNSNTWAARALYVAGCPIDVDAAVTAGSVLHQAVRFARVVRAGMVFRGSAEPSAECGPPLADTAIERQVERLGQSR